MPSLTLENLNLWYLRRGLTAPEEPNPLYPLRRDWPQATYTPTGELMPSLEGTHPPYSAPYSGYAPLLGAPPFGIMVGNVNHCTLKANPLRECFGRLPAVTGPQTPSAGPDTSPPPIYGGDRLRVHPLGSAPQTTHGLP